MPTFPVTAGTLDLTANKDWLPIPNQDVYLECATSGGAIIINLPLISGWNTKKNVKFYISDMDGQAATYPITINAQQGNFINGGSQVVINTSYGQGYILITNPTNYLYSSDSSSSETSETVFDNVSGTFALPLLYIPAIGEVVNIFTQLKAVSDNGDIYSISMTRTIIGIAGDPLGAIEPIGAAVLVTSPAQTRGAPGFSVSFADVDTTGFIQFTSVAGQVITVTVKESYT